MTHDSENASLPIDQRLAQLSPAHRELLRLRLARAAAPKTNPVAVPRRSDDAPAELSFAQQRLWFLNQLETASGQYNIPLRFQLNGRLDTDALGWALEQIVARHESLRTSFVAVDGTPVQRVHPPADFRVEFHDATGITEAAFDSEVLTFSRTSMDLENELPVRARLYQRSPGGHVLLVVFHHVAFDGTSAPIFIKELEAFYGIKVQQTAPILDPLPLQYADYAHWQRVKASEGAFDPQIDYWMRQLHEVPQVLTLPVDHLRPVHPSHQGSTIRRKVSSELAQELRRLAKLQGATLFMTLLAAFQVVLSRYSGQKDFLTGIPSADPRPQGTEALIGFFTNTLLLRADLAGDPTFEELLRRTRQTAREAYANSLVPFDLLVEKLKPERTLSRAPLVQVMFGLLDRVGRAMNLPGVDASVQFTATETAKFDLSIHVRDDGTSLEFDANYSSDVFYGTTIERMLEQYVVLLESAVRTPSIALSRLNMLPEAENNLVRFAFNATQRPCPGDRVHRIFERQTESTPDVIAAVDSANRWTYRQLDRRANAIAELLRAKGVVPGTLVALCVPRGVEFPAAVLGVWKAGASYVPLDADYPAERIAYLVQNSGAVAILTLTAVARVLPALPVPTIVIEQADRFSGEGASAEGSPNELAYVMYTSGSTGAPHGVEIPHRAIVRLVIGSDFATLGPKQVFLQMASLQFDASVFEIWAPLLTGGKVVFYPGRIPEAQVIKGCIQAEGVSTVWLTSTLYNGLIDEAPDSLHGLEQLLIGGEALSVPHVRKGLDLLAGTLLINGYGPTESTVFACCYPIPRPLPERIPSIPIGAPIANTRIYILDDHLQPCPIGVPGEIAIAGEGLALGYRNQPELTAARFVNAPWGEPIYRTGDIGRWRDPGVVEFLGRADHQVKIRGHRIELGEIEASLERCPGIARSVVVVREWAGGERQLVGYVVKSEAVNTSIRDIQAHLAQELPAYMLPAQVIAVPEFPTNEHGKLDTAKLPKPEDQRDGRTSARAPHSAVESKLLQLCEDLLPDRLRDVATNLFDAGLHSLTAAKLGARIARTFAKPVPLNRIFEFPTIERLAAFLEHDHQGEDLPVLRLQPYGALTPLFLVHAGPYFLPLAARLGPDRPVVGLGEPPGLPRLALEAYAERHVKTIRAMQPHGPYAVGGWCVSGNVAYEIAQQLRAAGEEVAIVILLDAANHAALRARPVPDRLRRWARRKADAVRHHRTKLVRLSGRDRARYLRERVASIWHHSRRAGWQAIYETQQRLGGMADFFQDGGERLNFAAQSHEPRPYPGRVLLVRQTERRAPDPSTIDLGWRALIGEGLEVQGVMGGHMSMLEEPNVANLAELLNSRLTDALKGH